MDYNIYIHYEETKRPTEPTTTGDSEVKPFVQKDDGDFKASNILSEIKSHPAVLVGTAVATASLKATQEIGNYQAILGGDYRLSNAVDDMQNVMNAVFHPISTIRNAIDTNIRNDLANKSNKLQAELLGGSVLTERGV